MSKVKEIAYLLLGFGLIGGALWFIWKVINLFFASLSEADPQVAASIIGGIATLTVGLAAVLYTQNQIKRREIDEAHRGKKVELYDGFLHIVQRLMAGENEDIPVEPLADDEMLIFMLNFKTEIILWSGPGVLNAYRKFEDSSGTKGGIDKLLPAVDGLYREMRKDIGLSNQGLPSNQLVKMYLKYPRELDEALSKSTSNK